MVLILDGNLEIGVHCSVHVRSNLCHLICLRHLIRSRAVTNLIFPLYVRNIATKYTYHDINYKYLPFIGLRVHFH